MLILKVLQVPGQLLFIVGLNPLSVFGGVVGSPDLGCLLFESSELLGRVC
jgi:hypothetical protein